MSFNFFKDKVGEDISSTWNNSTNTNSIEKKSSIVKSMFDSCDSKIEVKKLYKENAKIVHPDHGGNVQLMQQLNNYYQIALIAIKNGVNPNGRKAAFADTFGW